MWRHRRAALVCFGKKCDVALDYIACDSLNCTYHHYLVGTRPIWYEFSLSRVISSSATLRKQWSRILQLFLEAELYTDLAEIVILNSTESNRCITLPNALMT